MGRKWTNIKFVLDGRDTPITEASSDPRTKEEALFDFLRERWDDENVSPMENIDLMFGNPSENKLQNWMHQIFGEFEFVQKAGVVFVTDSAHIGYGKVFERNEDTAEVIEEYTGYQGAKGNDVAGMIREDHRIKVSPDWYWD